MDVPWITEFKINFVSIPSLFFLLQNEYTGDSQLLNSVYLDNSSLEVYHGRLEERPTALAVRISWQGPQEPNEVSIERKSQKPTAKGYEVMQDQMTLPENMVVGFIEGEVDVEVAKEFWQGKVRFEKFAFKLLCFS